MYKRQESHDGDIEKSIDYLREKGIAKAVKKAGRIAAEGLIFDEATPDHKKAVILEFNSETDFVAKNEEFKEFGKKLVDVYKRQHLDLVLVNFLKPFQNFQHLFRVPFG